MEFEDRHRYQDHPPAAVLRMVTDPGYYQRKYRALAVDAYTVLEQQSTPQRFRIRYRFRAAGHTRIPDFARRFVGETAEVTQTDAWEPRTGRGSIDIEIRGAPAQVHADLRLEADGAGAVVRMRWSVRCAIPLLGGKVEKIIAEDIRHRARQDEIQSQRIVEDYR